MNDPMLVAKLILLGLSAGVLSGLFGIGGGLVIVPALVLIFSYQTKMAVGTSLLSILLPTGILGVYQYWKRNEINVSAGLWIALGLFMGAYLGGRLAGQLSPILMKRLYALFMIVVAIYFLVAPEGAKPRANPAPGSPTNAAS